MSTLMLDILSIHSIYYTVSNKLIFPIIYRKTRRLKFAIKQKSRMFRCWISKPRYLKKLILSHVKDKISIVLLSRQVSVEVMEFPPLPPSPVEEADEESCSDAGQGAMMTPPKSKSHNRTVEYRPRVPPHRIPPVIDPKEQASLNTRSMDAGYSRGRRTPTTSNSRREVG